MYCFFLRFFNFQDFSFFNFFGFVLEPVYKQKTFKCDFKSHKFIGKKLWLLNYKIDF